MATSLNENSQMERNLVLKTKEAEVFSKELQI